jgi:transcriptional regulator with XRE-family HTH domain
LYLYASRFVKKWGEKMREWLKRLREENGLTMKEMGAKLGISESYYCTIESGNRQRDMNLSIAGGISSIFEISMDQVLEYEADKVS